MQAILSCARLVIEKIAQERMQPHKLQQYFGRIDLRETPAPADMQAGRVLQVRVTDSGAGIPRHELDAIFHKFVQRSRTRSNAGGTGLGLASSREIAHAHGGQIWVESELGRGSTFIVSLPLSEASSADAGEQSMRPEMAEPSAAGA